jgi:hypothetical protein
VGCANSIRALVKNFRLLGLQAKPSFRTPQPPTEITFGDADGYSAGRPASPAETKKLTPDWTKRESFVASLLDSEPEGAGNFEANSLRNGAYSLGILAADERGNRSIFHERFAVLNTHDGVCPNSLAAPTPAGSTPLADSATGRN